MEKTPSTTCNAVSVVREQLKDCPVAMRLYDRTADGLPLGAVAMVNATPTVASADESVRTKSVSVERYAEDFGERSLAALIVAHLSLVEDMLNVARPLKAEAMAMLAKKVAQTLLADDVAITLADLQLIADRLVSGEVYGGLNAALVMRTVEGYIAEKGEAFVNMRIEENARYKGDTRRENRTQTERQKNREAMHEYRLNRMQKTEVSSQKTEDRRQKSGDRMLKS